MSTHNICFYGKIRKKNHTFVVEKMSYLKFSLYNDLKLCACTNVHVL